MKSLGWSEEQMNIIRDGYATGVSLEQIAQRLGRKRTTVQSMAGRMGLRHALGPKNQRYIQKDAATLWCDPRGTRSDLPTLAYVPLPEHSKSYAMQASHVD